MTAAPITATCTAVFPLAGTTQPVCDRLPHADRMHVACIQGVPLAWSDPNIDALPDWERATLAAVRDVYGDDLPAAAAARVEALGSALVTLRAHLWLGVDAEGEEVDIIRCSCGWRGQDHERHVAEQLWATGALDRNAAPVVRVVKAAAAMAERIGPGRRAATTEVRELIAAVAKLEAGS